MDLIYFSVLCVLLSFVLTAVFVLYFCMMVTVQHFGKFENVLYKKKWTGLDKHQAYMINIGLGQRQIIHTCAHTCVHTQT